MRDETRMAASRWIFQNVPGPVNLRIETADDDNLQPAFAHSQGHVDSAGHALHPYLHPQP